MMTKKPIVSLSSLVYRSSYRFIPSSLLLFLPFSISGSEPSSSFHRPTYRHLLHPDPKYSTFLIRNMSSTAITLPSTMKGPPVSSLIEPGHCQFTTEWTPVPLLQRWLVSPTTSLLRFGLPDPTKSLQLSTCACILAKVTIDGEDVIRPYTPISTNADVGYFDLLVKNYGPTAKMSRYMNDVVQVNETSIEFKHIEFNVKIQAPFGNPKSICMIVGGTGITPMIQALHAILGDKADKPKVTMLYGSKYANDILGYEILEQWSTDNKDRLEVIHVLSDEPADSSWTGARGFINQTLIEKYVPSPSEDPLIFICGPPPMYNALSGPREEKNVTGLLGTMGYQTEHVFKF